jgi:hypothetical protein
MNKHNWIPKCAALLGFFLAPLCVVSGQSDRTFVSGLGDDANTCSRNSPCKSFAGASNKTNPGLVRSRKSESVFKSGVEYFSQRIACLFARENSSALESTQQCGREKVG